MKINQLNTFISSSLFLTTIILTGCGGGGSGSSSPPPLIGIQMGGGYQGTPLNGTTVSTLAGSGNIGSTDGSSTSSSFDHPFGITSDGYNLYIADQVNNKIRKIVISSGTVSTIAGSGTAGSTDSTGVSASFNQPWGITTDGTNIFVADTLNNKIRKIVISSGIVTTLAGSGTAGSNNATGISATFSHPDGITTDGTNLYVTDSANNLIRKIVISSGVVTTLAGSGTAASGDGTGLGASFKTPMGITTDGTNLYITDFGSHYIRKVEISSTVVTTVAGTGSTGSTNATGTAASFNQPTGITTDGTNLFVADYQNNMIRKIVIPTGAVTLLSGTGLQGSTNGAVLVSSYWLPAAITSDGSSLFVVDSFNELIRKIH
jgi:DNA-binding beta-propeller fold protein YncE